MFTGSAKEDVLTIGFCAANSGVLANLSQDLTAIVKAGGPKAGR